MKVIMVTGASGFIGTHLIKYFTEHDQKVVAVLHDEVVWTKWLQESLAGTVRVKGDVRDTQFIMRVLNQYKVTDVVHLAAQSIVKRAYKDPVNTFAINVMGTVSVLEAARQLQTPKVLIQSTDKVYGDNLQVTIDSKLLPTEPYGTSKICMDIIAQTYRQTYGMPVVVTRPCNVYGYDPCNDRIIPNTIKKCMKGEKPFIFKDEASLRQYIFVDDVCEVLQNLLEFAECAPIVNIASNTILSQQEVVLKILQSFPGLSAEYIEKPSFREIHSQSMDLYMHAESPTEFPDGIQRTIEAFQKYGGDGFCEF